MCQKPTEMALYFFFFAGSLNGAQNWTVFGMFHRSKIKRQPPQDNFFLTGKISQPIYKNCSQLIITVIALLLFSRLLEYEDSK